MSFLNFLKRRKKKARGRTPGAAPASVPGPAARPADTRPAPPIVSMPKSAYDRVYAEVMANVEGLSQDDVAELLLLVKESGSDGLNLGGYFTRGYERFFKNRAWRWREYDEWRETFEKLAAFPSNWTDINYVPTPANRPTHTRLLDLDVVELQHYLTETGVAFDASLQKTQLASMAEHTEGLKTSKLWTRLLKKEDEAVQEAIARRPKVLYDLLMRTIAYRAKSIRDLERAQALGIRKHEVMLVFEADRRFVDLARKKNPDAVPPYYPNDFTQLRPILGNDFEND